MDRIISVLDQIGSLLSDFFEVLTTAFSMVNMSVHFVIFFVDFLPVVIGSAVLVFIAVYVFRFIFSK